MLSANRLDNIPATVATTPMTAAEIAAVLGLHPQNVRERVYALVKQGVLEVVLPRAPANKPQSYRTVPKDTGNAFTSVRPRGASKGHS